MRPLRFVLLAVASLGGGCPVAAQESYPAKQITIVNPYAPGGVADAITRALAQRLSDQWHKPVVVENRSGGSTQVGAAYVAKSPPDGYTLLATDGATFMNSYLYPKANYDAAKDLIAVSGLGSIDHVLAANPSIPAATIGDLIALGRAKPKTLTYAIIGWGSPNHVSMELLQGLTGSEFTPVYYKGGAPALTDVIGGHISMTFLSTTLIAPTAKAGQVRALGIGSLKRLPQLPDIPTVAETVPGYEASYWYGLFAPRGTPDDVVNTLNKTVQTILQDANFRKEFLDRNFYEPIIGSPAQFGNHVESSVKKWAGVMQTAKASPEAR